MLGLFACPIRKCCLALLVFSLVANFTWAQSETATVSGQVVDPSGLKITGAQVKLVDIDRDTSTSATTNNSGLYTFPTVKPGRYRMEVTAAGFKVVNVTGLAINVQDHLEQNFKLVVGSISESMTVEASGDLVNTESAAVSTVVDRQFAENLPMNGRSFQTLIDLTPGVVLVPSNSSDTGQFSVNGQRAASNYWMVDGVSANVGVGSSYQGNGLGGAAASFSALGGTNSLVSVDAMQEFRIQTSTYAPEFGRTPGAQISIVTRSGTNQFHATAFDYLRNDALDGSDWFNGYTNYPRLPKAKERQNDFGGTFSGPIIKDRTFAFFSYEGLRLRLPQTSLTTVPDATFTPGGTTDSRQNAISALQPFLNAFPLPNAASPEIFAPCDASTDPTCPPSGQKPTGAAYFNASYSDPASLDAYSIRVDHKFNDSITCFGRYNDSPSEFVDRGGSAGVVALSTVERSRITTETATGGLTWVLSPVVANDFRFNYSQTNAASSFYLDSFGGAVPLAALPLPAGYSSANAQFSFYIFSLQRPQLITGANAQNIQRQINLVDSLAVQKGTHTLKFGVDFRRLSPSSNPFLYAQTALFADVPSAQAGNSFLGLTKSLNDVTFLFRNLGMFAQDTWRAASRLTLTYGIRWDVDAVPSSLHGPSIPAITGYNLNDFSQLAIAPEGAQAFRTRYGNLAPRIGLAYRVTRNPDRESVVRGGFGVFYDLVSSETGNLLGNGFPPFGASNGFSGTFPYTPTQIAPPTISPTGSLSQLYAFNPGLRLPYTLEWNVAFEQSLGKQQTLSASYIGAAGRRLLQSSVIDTPSTSPTLVGTFIDNTANSSYDALQIQFQRKLSHGLETLASYTWSHSIDDGSAGSPGLQSNLGVPGSENQNRGSSDFDVRHAFSAGVTYDVFVPKFNRFGNALLGGWSLQNVIQAHSAPPVDISDTNFSFFDNGVLADIRPDRVVGQPFYLQGSQYPGRKAVNPAAFTNPPVDPTTGFPLRQGDLGRNVLRGFGATQWDFAVHREFPIHESLKLQFRAEMFNVLNHPNFGPPNNQFTTPLEPFFGVSTEMLGRSLAGQSQGNGGFDPLYQIGGPRSIQFALKVMF
jgi:hypothetical protein